MSPSGGLELPHAGAMSPLISQLLDFLSGQAATSCPSSKAALGQQLGGDRGGESPPLQPPGSPAASCRAAAQAGPQHLLPSALQARGRLGSGQWNKRA